MVQNVLITGGAGFIGRFVAAELLARGDHVKVLDSLIEQVHGADPAMDVIDPAVDFIRGDVRDGAVLAKALEGVDKVVHLAAEVGVGQSMYAIERYVSVNDLGTASLFQALIEKPVQRVVVASSMSIYGEGLYRDSQDVIHEDVLRKPRLPRPTPRGIRSMPTASRWSRFQRPSGSGRRSLRSTPSPSSRRSG